MPLIPLKLPPGIYRVGTDFEGSNRWRDQNLIRWEDQSMRPIGGWSERDDLSSDFTSSQRAAHVWIDNSGGANQAYGSADELLYVNASGTSYDITPASFTTGDEDAAINRGFGGGFYGNGYYGTRRLGANSFQEAATWSLDNYGENLVAVSTSDGKLYEWALDTAVNAVQITNSPTSCKGLVVTEERFIFALQAGGNKRKISWCDREDNTVWTAAATNEAGDQELQTSGEIMCGVRMRGRTLILTNVDAHIATYQGPPYVYGFERVGTACGTVSRKSAVAIDQGAFWMGNEGFFVFDGSIAKRMKCDVLDAVFDDINHNQISKVFAVHNSEHSEVWWFYPSNSSSENDRYVYFNYIDNYWGIGQMDRTCGSDKGVFDNPIWVESTGQTYDQEVIGASHGTDTPFCESGPISLGNGDTIMKVNEVIGDEGTQGQVKLQFKTRFYPNETERTYPTGSTYYSLSNAPTSVRFSGRQMRMRVTADTNQSFRVGTMRVNAQAGGRR